MENRRFRGILPLVEVRDNSYHKGNGTAASERSDIDVWFWVMKFPIVKPLRSVGRLGAEPDAVLRGVGEHNRGLLLRSTEAQARGHDGPIQGPFVIVDVGDNRHSDTLSPLLNKVTDAGEVLALLRKKHPACVSVVNANSLTSDREPAPTAETPSKP